MDELKEIQKIANLAKIYYVRQKEQRGLGHAILCAKSFIGDEPFAVLLGDDIVVSDIPCLKQLLTIFDYYNTSVLGVQEVAEKDVSKYGIIETKGFVNDNTYYVNSLVEKPMAEEAPSNLAIMGRYVLRPEIFSILEQTPIGKGGELQLTDAIDKLNKQQAVLACEFQGKRHDIGNKLSYIKATIDLALQRNDIKPEILAYLKELAQENE